MSTIEQKTKPSAIKNLQILKNRPQSSLNSGHHSLSLKQQVKQHSTESFQQFKLQADLTPLPHLITIKDINPELAAQIVRHYILPLFDQKPSHQMKKKGTVHHDLSLASQLGLELGEVKIKVQDLHQQLELSEQKLRQAETEIKQLRKRLNLNQVKFKSKKFQIQQSVNISNQYQSINSNLENQVSLLDTFCQLLDSNQKATNRKLFTLQYQYELILRESQYKEYSQIVNRVEKQVILDQYARLFLSMQQFGDQKLKEDECNAKLISMQQELNEVKTDLCSLQISNSDQISIMTEAMMSNQRMFSALDTSCLNEQILREAFKLQGSKHQQEREELQKQLDQVLTQLSELKKSNEGLAKQNEILRKRTLKLKVGRQTKDLIICKKCNSEYTEDANFNWSCRVHQSEFSGQMWWCCGKTQQDALGCKFSKHEYKFDKDDEIDVNFDKFKIKYNQKCQCCKQLGHQASKCSNDPNIMTTNRILVNQEDERVRFLAKEKKHNANTNIQTTHFLKKCAIIKSESSNSSGKELDNPFKRGVLTFDDYNYKMFNPFILVKNSGETRKQIMKLTEINLKQIGKVDTQADQVIEDDAVASEASELQEEKRAGTEERQSRVFFTKKDIIKIQQCQSQDQFKDLLKLRNQSTIENIYNGITTQFTIADHAPKSLDQIELQIKQSKKQKIKRVKEDFKQAQETQFVQSQSSQERQNFRKAKLTREQQQTKIEQENLLGEIKDLIIEKLEQNQEMPIKNEPVQKTSFVDLINIVKRH